MLIGDYTVYCVCMCCLVFDVCGVVELKRFINMFLSWIGWTFRASLAACSLTI